MAAASKSRRTFRAYLPVSRSQQPRWIRHSLAAASSVGNGARWPGDVATLALPGGGGSARGYREDKVSAGCWEDVVVRLAEPVALFNETGFGEFFSADEDGVSYRSV